jgi:CDP-diacylglycerol--glycerol-3-phosphate 3-phosphatidyltransferase
VAKIGGTALVGRGIMDATYWAIEPVVRGLAAAGVTPNGLTWSALVLGLGAGVALAFGWFGAACLLATMSTIGDILDGQVARLTNSGSDRGELLDAAVDRYTEFAFLAGLVIFLRDSWWRMALALAPSWRRSWSATPARRPRRCGHAAARPDARATGAAIYLIIGIGLVPGRADPGSTVRAVRHPP